MSECSIALPFPHVTEWWLNIFQTHNWTNLFFVIVDIWNLDHCKPTHNFITFWISFNQLFHLLLEMHSLKTTFLVNAYKVRQNANKHLSLIRYANNLLLSVNWMKISYRQHFINILVAKIIQFSIFLSKFMRWVIHNIITDDFINNCILTILVFTWSKLFRNPEKLHLLLSNLNLIENDIKL